MLLGLNIKKSRESCIDIRRVFLLADLLKNYYDMQNSRILDKMPLKRRILGDKYKLC